MPAVTAEATGAADTADQISLHLKKEHRGFLESLGVSACRKSLFSPLSKFSELYKSSENLGFQWRRETGEAPPVADQASLFRGRLPISGYAVSADWLEPTVYPFLGYLRAKSRLAAVALRNTPAGVVPHTPYLSIAENLPLYRQSQGRHLCRWRPLSYSLLRFACHGPYFALSTMAVISALGR